MIDNDEFSLFIIIFIITKKKNKIYFNKTLLEGIFIYN